MNQKGLAAIFSTLLYIFISLIVLAIVVPSAITLISETREAGEYRTMLGVFYNVENAIDDVISEKKELGLIIQNPGEIDFDCNNNIIIGTINYKQKYRTDPQLIDKTIVYKNQNKIYFEYNLNNSNRIKLDCNNFYLTAGKKNININYSSYNDTNDNILVTITQNSDN